jgi:hypothetical protein
MITVAADKASNLTGIDTVQYTRTWHMHDTAFLLNVSNNLNAATREYKTMQENEYKIVLDCMTMKVIECEDIFKYTYKKELSSLHEEELNSNEYMGVIERFCQR